MSSAGPSEPYELSGRAEALNEAGKVRVTWDKPTADQVVTGYTVKYKKRESPSYTTCSVSSSTITFYTITELNLGVVYDVKVAAVGPQVNGYFSDTVTTYNCECMYSVVSRL